MYKPIGVIIMVFAFFMMGLDVSKRHKKRVEAMKSNVQELERQIKGFKQFGKNPVYVMRDIDHLSESDKDRFQKAETTKDVNLLEMLLTESEETIAEIESKYGGIAKNAPLLGIFLGLVIAVILY